jgi:hypothetical protein
MKLYRVLNGYQGFGEVKVFVVAPNEKRAIELARERYKKETESEYNPYDEDYYKNLEADCMCSNLDQEWISEVHDY